uniref:Peptidase S1 domain-containing protein n=1 Tax=Dendroctonus ponderosae TaxID=77166 RepID=A0AAR5QH24_DENPD
MYKIFPNKLSERWKHLFVGLCWVISVKSQTIARQKCEEYSRAVYEEDGDKIFSLRSLIKNHPISTCALYENPLIVGGTPARSREFPHMAVIGFAPTEDSEMDWLCGGSLISDQHVLTAAHCSISHSGPPQKVRLGSVSLHNNDDFVQDFIIDYFVNHPEYKRPMKYHDIAIMFLKKFVTFTAFVRPACLNTVEKLPFTEARATGFGLTTHGNQSASSVLMKVDLDIIPNENCTSYLKFRKHVMPRNLINEMMCAGYLKGGRDTCQGDSGGPL